MIDLYCERLGPEFWAEPINATTNVSFLIAAYAAWRVASARSVLHVEMWLLLGLMVAIGVGSFLFHTFATTWARILDVVPILMFQVVFLFVYAHRIIQLRPFSNLAGIVVFIMAALACRSYADVLNGSLIYAPAIITMLGLGVYHRMAGLGEPNLLVAAWGVFSLAVFLRAIDMLVCPYFTVGTHFLWHLLNGLVSYLAFRALAVNIATVRR